MDHIIVNIRQLVSTTKQAGVWFLNTKLLLLTKRLCFIDDGQCLGAGWSWDVSLGDLDGDINLDPLISHGRMGLSQGGGRPNEVWWNEITEGA